MCYRRLRKLHRNVRKQLSNIEFFASIWFECVFMVRTNPSVVAMLRWCWPTSASCCHCWMWIAILSARCGHGGCVHQPANFQARIEGFDLQKYLVEVAVLSSYSQNSAFFILWLFSYFLSFQFFWSYDVHEAIVESIGHLLSAEGLVGLVWALHLGCWKMWWQCLFESRFLFFEHLNLMPKGKDVVSSDWCWKLTVFGCFKVSSNKVLMMEVALRQKVGFWWSMSPCES